MSTGPKVPPPGGSKTIFFGGLPPGGPHVPSDPAMQASTQVAGALVRDVYAQRDPGMIRLLDSLQPQQIVVVRGQYDHIDHVLQAAGIPFTQVGQEDVSAPLLAGARAVFVNCAGSFPRDSARRIADFVHRGGLLVSTDWCLKSLIQVVFPGTVEHNGRGTGNEHVSIELARADDPLTRWMFEGEARPVWWLEGSSYPIRVLSPEGVEVVIRSKELKERWGEDPVAVRFGWGKGGVYHLISHLYLQSAEARHRAHRAPASTFVTSMGGAATTIQWAVEEAERTGGTMNAGSVQAAATTMFFVTQVLGSHMRGGSSPRPASGSGRATVRPPETKPIWKAGSRNLKWDPDARVWRYRMPAGTESVVIGRSSQADETILGDERLSRRHAEIRRVRTGDKVEYLLTVLSDTNGVLILRPQGRVTMEINRFKSQGPTPVQPGDILYLTPDISFVFDPRSGTTSDSGPSTGRRTGTLPRRSG